MVENIVNKFEKTMKKGFVNIFVLLALNKEPTYGYQIKKLIEDRTFGFWSPSDSTMYTILNNLREKGLIRQSDIQDSDDTRKVEREMRESMRSIIFSTSEINNDFLEDSFQDFIFRGPKSGISPMHGHSMKGSFMSPFKGDFMGILNHKSKEDQIKLLNTGKKFIAEKIQNFTQILKNIDEKISDLESETKSK